ncbi:MAG: GntR family transcriptional regulator [Paracoccus denitrificans]|uniref:GntR family transcriptional regulator n=1 Tax=Paracoccus denitrificans TaxID=266 RepID=A0A533I2M0_PARDE|nr:MAG: GntR family transcriptional regulator [Paracoccus denitrificans]
MTAQSKPERVAAQIEAEIRGGSLGHGDPLASENALVRRFSVSRTTVRRGLEILAERGLIETRVGIGSFVTFDGKVLNSDMGWAVGLQGRDIALTTRVLRIVKTRMDLDAPGFNTDDHVLAVDRVRYRGSDGLGLTLERSRMHWREDFVDIVTFGLDEDSLSRTLQNRGLIPSKGEEWASIQRSLSLAESRMLNRPTDEPMLLVKRLTRSANDSVVEYVETLLDADNFGLRMEF